MFNKKSLIALLCVCFVGAVFALTGYIPDSTKTLTGARSMTPYLYNGHKPFNYIIPIDVSAANWTCPDSVVCEGIYVARFTNVKFKLRSSDTLTFPIDSLCGLPFDVTNIYTTGTDAGSRTNKIFIIGRKR